MTVQRHVVQKVEIVQEHEVTDSVTCDICGVVQRHAYQHYDGVVEWKNGSTSYHVEKTAIVYEHGANYPEGGHSDLEILHICPTCFTEHILPLAKGKQTHARRDW